jgi:hypothetical protein
MDVYIRVLMHRVGVRSCACGIGLGVVYTSAVRGNASVRTADTSLNEMVIINSQTLSSHLPQRRISLFLYLAKGGTGKRAPHFHHVSCRVVSCRVMPSLGSSREYKSRPRPPDLLLPSSSVLLCSKYTKVIPMNPCSCLLRCGVF